jgi:hypothetical protein
MAQMNVFLLKFLSFYLGCFSSVLLQTQFRLSAVLSAAIVGFVGSFYPFSRFVLKGKIRAIIYAGAFAGMCAPEHLIRHEYILLISLLGTGIYFIGRPHFDGFGGKLGTIAFISSLFLLLIKGLW